MKNQCCGKPCVTPFCPTCGKMQAEDDASLLLAHIRKNANSFRVTARNQREKVSQYPEYEDAAKRNDVIAVRWERWATLVAAWIARDNEVS